MESEVNGSYLQDLKSPTRAKQPDKSKNSIEESLSTEKEPIMIKVGVGGLFINNNVCCSGSKKPCVLLYKRYKEPEIHQWSLLGGSVKLYQTCEAALKEKIIALTQNTLTDKDIDINDVIVAVNHFDSNEKYHYVSPQYYVKINSSYAINKLKTTEKIINDTSKVVILDSVEKLKESIKKKYNTYSTKEKPWLSYVPIDVIRNMDGNERNQIFIRTTVEAILTHCELYSHISEIENKTKTYQSWHRIMEE